MAPPALTLLSAPASEPVTLAQAKLHLRIDHEEEDDYLNDIIIPSARQRVERETHRALISQQWRLTLDAFPDGAVHVPLPPLISVDAITYLDPDGDSQTLSSALYRVVTTGSPGRIVPTYGYYWPSTRDIAGAVTVDYTAGYASIPGAIISAILLLVGHLYENREAVTIAEAGSALPLSVQWLLEPYVVVHL